MENSAENCTPSVSLDPKLLQQTEHTSTAAAYSFDSQTAKVHSGDPLTVIQTFSDPGAGQLVTRDITLLQAMPRHEPEATRWKLTEEGGEEEEEEMNDGPISDKCGTLCSVST